ncbi:MAG TPA: adenylate/guanylate cyclase domain-containing protein, partial [Candidatus Nitrosocosmicus sp.]|nr:adenylate/guanylate cyclase domain-containing protein [Candidatus Nitrosocosmicus sp.]
MIDGLNDLSNYNRDNTSENAFNSSSSDISRSKSDSNSLTKESNQEQINFINFTQQYCIGFIDIINSTQETAKIKDPKKLRKYYSLFLNSMSTILNQYNGKIIKNSGDNLFFYFPKTSNLGNQQALQDVFDCSASMIESNKPLNQELAEEDLPPINYRISMNYGLVEVALGSNNKEVDLFGSVVNECAKINSLSKSNGLVIGKNLYNLLIKSTFGKEIEISEIELSLDGCSKNITSYYTIMDNRKILASNKQDESLKHQVPNEIKKPSQIKNKHYSILLIDDEEDILYTYHSLLKKEGYQVHSYSNPIEALENLAKKNSHSYDLVVMDIRMPGVSG